MDLNGKVALVTGSSSGIGRSIVLALAREKCKLVVNSRKNKKDGEFLADEIIKRGGNAVYVQADISDKDQVKVLFKQIDQKFGVVDLLVNNAGESRGGEFDDMELWRYQLENILLTQVIVTSEFLKQETKNLRKIVNTSSIYGSTLGGNLDFIAYSAAKAAVNSVTINLAKKLWGKVLVNAVAPGWTWTPPWGNDRGEAEKELKDKLPIGRFVEPGEIADMVVAIFKNDAITGQVITVDGGATLKELY